MPTAKPVFDRPDTLLGICEAIGQDCGISPLPLRIVLAVSLLWDPWVSLGAYAVLGFAVLVSRLLFPVRAQVEPVVVAAAPIGDNDAHGVPTAIAA